MIRLIHGSSPEALCTLDDNSVDSIVTDPPYGLSFMGKTWDYDVPSVDVWRECLRVLKPGGHLLAFAGTRTQHRMAVRIEDAGFEIRDMIAWVYGSGFPKSLDVSKAIDKAAGRIGHATESIKDALREAHTKSGRTLAHLNDACGFEASGYLRASSTWASVLPPSDKWPILRDALGLSREMDALFQQAEREVVGFQKRGNAVNTDFMSGGNDITAPATDLARQWQGWGTALKPALEPITVARKPLIGTVAENVTTWGTGAINVDGGRVNTGPVEIHRRTDNVTDATSMAGKSTGSTGSGSFHAGRFPANLIHDGSDEVVGLFPMTTSGALNAGHKQGAGSFGKIGGAVILRDYGNDSGSAARFFYCAKASRSDREDGCDHLPAKTAGEVTGGREEGSAGLDSPRAGAGRGTGSRNHHPTVKPTDLMRYLCRLVTQPGGVILDPFMGSGSTGRGAVLEGFRFIGVEREADYLEIARARITAVAPEPEPTTPATTEQLALF